MPKSKSSPEHQTCMDMLTKKKQRQHYFADRFVAVNENRLDYPNNAISTGKYNVFNFLPKNLFFQFTKLANDYFVIIGLLQLIRAISTSNGTPFIFVPLSIIMGVTLLKDLSEDWKRHRSDHEENNKKVQIFQNGAFTTARWKDIRVGNVVKIMENEFFPADMLVLYSPGKKGMAFVETKNLDGETNLKQKVTNKDLAEQFDSDEKIARANNKFEYEKANDYLYKFVGSIESKGEKVPLGEQNFLLRGSSLRNTQYIIALVAYTGHHTKIMLNSVKAKPKLSKLERAMNKQIALVFAAQLCFCLFSAFYAAIWYAKKADHLGFLDIDRSGTKDNNFAYNLFVRLGNWLLIFTNFVPISLLVTLEMVKLFQGIFMTMDPKMTSTTGAAAGIKTTVNSSNLNEELGQIDYIFSDKTGTLTQNLMEFKNLSVKLKSYGDARTIKDTKNMPQVSNVDFLDQEFMDELANPRASNHENIVECLTALAICHTIITEEKDGQVQYNASSPDELALVNFAKFVGAEFIGTDELNNMEIKLLGKKQKFQLLHVLEFNSTRKRMSVIVKTHDGKIVLYCKGADSILLERMVKNDPAIDATQGHLHTYANKGLRTLLLSKRVLDNTTYLGWAQRYQAASTKIEGRDEAMEELQEEIEKNMVLVGATAIEDKLQDEVGLTISKLKDAGIRVWVLTGDKVETAINIGFSCKLLNDSLIQLEVTEKTHEEVSASLDAKIQIIKKVNGEHENFALIISGDALIHAMKPDLAKKIMIIAEVCKSVLACRVSPKQKQEIVSLVRKEKPTANTLAIGDGANDVFMITAANVGIGIRGVEGQQAAKASDFAIGEFKILRRLLYFHGREAYRRNSYLILYNFYKNMVLVLPQFWFAFFNGFSGQVIYEQRIFQLFNIFFASLPIIIYAVFDQEHEGSTLVSSPQLYVQGIKNKLFNAKTFWSWFVLGIWESAIVAFISFGAIDNNYSVHSGGQMFGLLGPGMLTFSCAVWIVNIKILVMSNTYNFLNLFCVFGSMGVYAFFFWVLGYWSSSEAWRLFYPLWSTPNFWIGSALVIAITYAFHTAFARHEGLITAYKQNKINPKEQEINRLVQNAGPMNLELHHHLDPLKGSHDSGLDASKLDSYDRHLEKERISGSNMSLIKSPGRPSAKS